MTENFPRHKKVPRKKEKKAIWSFSITYLVLPFNTYIYYILIIIRDKLVSLWDFAWKVLYVNVPLVCNLLVENNYATKRRFHTVLKVFLVLFVFVI